MISGVGVNAFGQAEASMGVTLGDADGDGDLDLFMTHLDRETNTFYQNLGRGLFADMTSISGLGHVSLPCTGFGTGFFDYDHDGDLDLFIANGHVRRPNDSEGVETRVTPHAGGVPVAPERRPYAQSDQLFENLGRGKFDDVSARAGTICLSARSIAAS